MQHCSLTKPALEKTVEGKTSLVRKKIAWMMRSELGRDGHG